MKRLATITVFLAILQFGCTKEDPTSDVVFSARETSAATPYYDIEYTSDKSGGTTVGSNNDNYWSSGKITLKQGQFVSFKVTCSEAVFTIYLDVYVKGNLWKTTSFNNPTPSVTVSGNIPVD